MMCHICILDKDTCSYDRLDLCLECYRTVKDVIDSKTETLKLSST